MCDGFGPLPVEPSPKLQAKDNASRSGSEESDPSNAIGAPVAPEYGPPIRAIGEMLVGTGLLTVIVTSLDADSSVSLAVSRST